MKHHIIYTDKALSDLTELDNSQLKQIRKVVNRVSTNPLPKNEGGYGNPLGNKYGYDLKGLFKIKLRKLGIRVVYKLVREGNIMKIIVVGMRSGEECYKKANERKDD
jgi:mRNA interferase RelE/StbE